LLPITFSINRNHSINSGVQCWFIALKTDSTDPRGDNMHLFRKVTLISLVLSGCLLGSVGPLQADQRRDCEKRIHKAEQNFNKEARKHGEHSRQAEKRRHELERVRDNCRGFDRDHDRDRNHPGY
jgi:hypothetical protein